MTAGTRPAPRLQPGWPLGLLFIGYPVWWLLGITLPVLLFVAVALFVGLARRPRISFPRYGTLWALFLVWVLAGVLLVQVDAPLAVEGWNTNRYFTWAFRLFWYLVATIVLLHLGNVRDRAELSRTTQAFGWMFVWIVAGGLLGVLLPSTDFPSLLQLGLPHGLASNAFVSSMVHPNLTEHMQFAGVTRPSAPFPYANVWGLNFACFLPFFCFSWCRRDAGWKRWGGPVVLVVAVVPVVFSLNRGLWVALAMAGLVLGARGVLAGNLRVVGFLAAAVVVLGLVLTVTPLRGPIEARFSSPNSNDGRSALALRSFAATNASPVVGFGTTRNVQGSLTSIAGGATPQCPRCAPPSLGTQGQLYLTTFAQGYVGAAFYLAFLAAIFWRAWRRPGAAVSMGLCVLAMHFATLFVYSADNLAIVPIFAAVAVLWRAGAEVAADPVPLIVLLWRGRRLALVTGAALGAVTGIVVHLALPEPVRVSTSVVVPVSAASTGSTGEGNLPVSMDTVAQLVGDGSITGRVARAVGVDVADVSSHLSVTAVPNTSVLNLIYSAPTLDAATVGSEAAASGLLILRRTELAAEHAAQVRALHTQLAAYQDALDTVATSNHRLREHRWGPVGHVALRQLIALRAGLVSTWQARDTDLRTVRSAEAATGAVVSTPRRLHTGTPWGMPIADGTCLGFLAAVLLGVRQRWAPLSLRLGISTVYSRKDAV